MADAGGDAPAAGAGGNGGGTKQEGGEGEAQYIRLKVVSQDGNEIHFRVKMTTAIGKLKKSYAERLGLPVNALRFLFEGRRLDDNESPGSIGMDDEDQIDAVQEQQGGGMR